MEEYEIKQPPILNLQLWDNDIISSDDFIGSLEINLSGFSEPFESAKKCKLTDVTQSVKSYGSTKTKVTKTKTQTKLINLFKKKKSRGWFAIRGNVKDKKHSEEIGLAGKIDLELEVLTKDEATLNPAGLGRDGPQKLEEPNRPETSFNPVSSPLKAFRRIVLPEILKYGVIIVIFSLLAYKLVKLVLDFSILSYLG